MSCNGHMVTCGARAQLYSLAANRSPIIFRRFESGWPSLVVVGIALVAPGIALAAVGIALAAAAFVVAALAIAALSVAALAATGIALAGIALTAALAAVASAVAVMVGIAGHTTSCTIKMCTTPYYMKNLDL